LSNINIHKWFWIPIIPIILLLAGILTSCSSNKEKEVVAPDFTLQTIDGQMITLSELRGEPVMLTFWSTTCYQCKIQEPFIQEFYEKWSDKALKLLTVNTGDNPLAVQQYLASANVTFPVLMDTKREVARSYGLPGVPVTFFIDARGYIAAYKIGAFQSSDEIEKAVDSIWTLLTKISYQNNLSPSSDSSLYQ